MNENVIIITDESDKSERKFSISFTTVQENVGWLYAASAEEALEKFNAEGQSAFDNWDIQRMDESAVRCNDLTVIDRLKQKTAKGKMAAKKLVAND
tara:strand:- start:712 stop:999 length:288 start_codon:yes stop_codon:yes gene_type:complete